MWTRMLVLDMKQTLQILERSETVFYEYFSGNYCMYASRWIGELGTGILWCLFALVLALESPLMRM